MQVDACRCLPSAVLRSMASAAGSAASSARRAAHFWALPRCVTLHAMHTQECPHT